MSHVPIVSNRGGTSFSSLPRQPASGQEQDDHDAHHVEAYGGGHYEYNMLSAEKYAARVDVSRLSSQERHGEYYPHMEGRDRGPPRHHERPNYKPSALRWPFLSLLLLLLLAMAGILAYALRVLPVEDMRPVAPTDLAKGLRRQITPRPTITTMSSTASTTSLTLDSSTRASIAVTRQSDDFGNVGTSVTVTSSSSEGEITSTVLASDFGIVEESIGSSIIQSVESTAPQGDHGHAGTVSVTVSTPKPSTLTFITPVVTTFTNSLGIPTYTLTSVPPPLSTPQTTVLTNFLGEATATQITSVLVTPTVVVETNANGVPTATVTSYPILPASSPAVGVFYISYESYFAGFFLPTVIAILLSIPVRILDRNAKLFQPWHELTHENGALGRESLCMETSGWQSTVTSVRSLFGGQALIFLTSVLVVSSALLIPLSAEAVDFKLVGSCRVGSGSAKNCAYVLSVFSQPAKATLALLALMGVVVLFLIGFLVRWKSGVSTNPWSICGIASLSHNRDVNKLFASLPAGLDAGKMPNGLLESVLLERRFKLGYFQGPKGNIDYGIMLHNEYPDNHPLYTPIDETTVIEMRQHHGPVKTKHHLPFFMLGYAGRFLFLFVLCGLLALILYYNTTGGDTPFENFMDSESFGVRFLFTGVGVIITFFWSSFFSSIASMSPYHLLSIRPQYARRSILLSPPTNAFSGIYSGIRRHHGFLSIVGVTAVLSEFLTVFLSNVPFRVTQTFLVARICTWSAVAILCIMILVVVASFFVKWPHMPLDPSTIAGAMYYICDSWMVEHFEGTSVLKRSERDWKINEMGMRYEFGQITGVSGTLRIGVDVASGIMPT